MKVNEKQITSLAASIIGCPEETVQNADNLFDIGLDSFAFMLLVEEIEKNYDLVLDTSELAPESFRTIMDVVTMIRKLQTDE